LGWQSNFDMGNLPGYASAANLLFRENGFLFGYATNLSDTLKRPKGGKAARKQKK